MTAPQEGAVSLTPHVTEWTVNHDGHLTRWDVQRGWQFTLPEVYSLGLVVERAGQRVRITAEVLPDAG